MDVPQMTDEQLGEAARKRLLGSKDATHSKPNPQPKNPKDRQIPILPGKLDEFLEKGFRWEANLPDGRILLSQPA